MSMRNVSFTTSWNKSFLNIFNLVILFVFIIYFYVTWYYYKNHVKKVKSKMLCSVILLEEISSGRSDESHCDTSKCDRLTKMKCCRVIFCSVHDPFIGFWDVGISLSITWACTGTKWLEKSCLRHREGFSLEDQVRVIWWKILMSKSEKVKHMHGSIFISWCLYGETWAMKQ